jgi:hypothetical protein
VMSNFSARPRQASSDATPRRPSLPVACLSPRPLPFFFFPFFA